MEMETVILTQEQENLLLLQIVCSSVEIPQHHKQPQFTYHHQQEDIITVIVDMDVKLK
jgi:hypothetical protein